LKFALFWRSTATGRHTSHWLAAADDTICLVMPPYWPKDTPPSALAAGEGI
jgi:hypothetical protein